MYTETKKINIQVTIISWKSYIPIFQCVYMPEWNNGLLQHCKKIQECWLENVQWNKYTLYVL